MTSPTLLASLGGKVALVTGGTRGIGLAIATALLGAGARVLVTGVDPASLAAAVPRLDAAATAHADEAAARSGSGNEPGAWYGQIDDLADPDAPVRVVNEALTRFGRLDVLFNNAGIAGPSDPWTTDVAAWDRVQAINLRGAYFCGRAAALAMKDGGHGGAIINVSSVAGQIGGVATGPAYVASKAGLIGLTRSMARHFAPFGVRVNCLAPADIDTDMVAGWPPELRQRLTAMTPLGRFGHVDEVAAVACFLASDGASYLTGQTLNVNGGIYMG